MGYEGVSLVSALTGLVQMTLLGFFSLLDDATDYCPYKPAEEQFPCRGYCSLCIWLHRMFANGALESIYPVTAALGLINYRSGTEGVMWNKGLCLISVLAMCAIGIAFMFINQSLKERG